MTLYPWVSITQTQAESACEALGPGYDLMTNAEWQTVAREVENAYSEAADIYGNTGYLNWSHGLNTGSNYLNGGNSSGSYSNGSTFSGIPADVDTNPCSGMAAYPNCAKNTSSDWYQKRTFELSNGNIVWDFAGNDYTWVKDTLTNQGGNGHAQSAPWSSGAETNPQAAWGPAGNYTTMNSGNYGGLGYQWLGYSGALCFAAAIGAAAPIPASLVPVYTTARRATAWKAPAAAGMRRHPM